MPGFHIFDRVHPDLANWVSRTKYKDNEAIGKGSENGASSSVTEPSAHFPTIGPDGCGGGQVIMKFSVAVCDRCYRGYRSS